MFRTLLVSAADDVRADRALRSGLLPRELDHLGIAYPTRPDIEASATAAERVVIEEPYLAEMRGLFFEHLDSRDRDGRAASPWAGDLAQAVQRTVDDARARLADEYERHEAGEVVAQTVWEIVNEQEFGDDADQLGESLYTKIDASVDAFDREFRLG
jgi:hypothetical protein